MPDMDLRILISARDATRGVLGGLSSALGALNPAAVGAGLAIAGVGLALGYSVKQAADFQQGLNRLKTGAGDTTDNLQQLGQGILKVSTNTGVLTSGTDGLNAAMYQIISSGQRGAEALDALNVSAKGSIIEQANVVDVAKAEATAMTDFGTSVFSATDYMNGYITAVAHGRITLEELATTMGPILPYAKNLGIAFSDVAGAMSTMTNAGIPAARAATSLRFLFQSLENPTKKALAAMQDFGVNSIALGDELRVSLPGALQMVYDAAMKAGPEGSVPFNRAVSDMIGGMRSMQAYLSLTGSHFHEFQIQAGDVAAAMKAGSKEVQGWSTVQGNLNLQLGRAHAAFDALAINLGTQLLPILTPIASKFADWLGNLSNVDFSGLTTAVKGLVDGLGTAFSLMGQVGNFFANSQGWKDAATNIGGASDQLGRFVRNLQQAYTQIDTSNQVGTWVKGTADGFGKILGFLGGIVQQIGVGVNGAMNDMLGNVNDTDFAFQYLGEDVKKTGLDSSDAARLVAAGWKDVQDAVTGADINLAKLAKTNDLSGSSTVTLAHALELVGKQAGDILTTADAAKLLAMNIGNVKDATTGTTIDLKNMVNQTGVYMSLVNQQMQQWYKAIQNGSMETFSQFQADLQNKAEKELKITGATADDTYRKLMNLNAPITPKVNREPLIQAGQTADETRRKLLALNGSSNWTANVVTNNFTNYINTGGPVIGRGFASGTQNYPGGVGLVGERGPELVQLPRGSRIYPNNQTRAMLSGRGLGGGHTFNITINNPMRTAANTSRMVDEIERELAVRFRQQTPNFGFGGLI